MIGAQSLLAARIEPGVEDAPALLDLVFYESSRIAVVPCIEIVPEMLEQRELSPFVWPHAYAATLAHEAADAIEAALLPWVEALAFSAGLNGEVVRVFGEGAGRALFQRAREQRFLGAAAYRAVQDDAGAYVFAYRFAQGRSVGIADERAACGAALLVGNASRVRADLGSPQTNALAQQWYGLEIFGTLEVRYDVGIGAGVEASIRIENPRTAPYNVYLPAECRRTPRPGTHFEVAAQGGSSGRVLIALRDDWQAFPDGDGDDAQSLAARLRSEGFTVDLAGASSCEPDRYDVVHAFTLATSEALLPMLVRARAAGTPIVVSAGVPRAFTNEALLVAISAASEMSQDEIELEDMLAALARHVQTPSAPAERYEESIRAVLRCANSVIACNGVQEALLRSWGFAGPVFYAPAYLQASAPPASIERIAGTADFVFAHAPIEPCANHLLLLRAAEQAELTLVIAGPVRDADYHRALLRFAGERVILIPEPEPAVRAALYRSARVFADVAWTRPGMRRIVEAAAGGCALVLAAGLGAEWSPGLWEAQPADVSSIAAALQDAWMHAGDRPEVIDDCRQRAMRSCEPRAALVATAQAYAAAAQSGVCA